MCAFVFTLNVTACCLVFAQITQQPPRTFTALVQESMAHAERIIKSVMLPIGSPAGGTSPPAPTPATSATAGASTNPFDTPAVSEAPPPPTPTGFVMGPISSKAAEAFVKSFLQLIPTADLQVLQKVMDMKVGFALSFIFTASFIVVYCFCLF